MRSRTWFSIAAIACLLFGACTTVSGPPNPPPNPSRISLDKSVHFAAPDGSDVVVPPGAYQVDHNQETTLRLVPVQGDPSHAIVIQALALQHDEQFAASLALSIPYKEDEHHVVLLMPEGNALDAAGSYSGARTRASAVLPYPTIKQLAQAQPMYAHAFPQMTTGADLVMTSVNLVVRQPGQTSGTVGAPVYTNSIVLISVKGRNNGGTAAVFPVSALNWKLVGGPPGVGAVGIFPCGSQNAVGQPSRIEPGQECGGGINFITPGQVAAGTYTLTVMIDPDNKVLESNEGNNKMSITMVVNQAPAGAGPAELLIEQVNMVPGQGPIDPWRANVTIRNLGPGDAFFPGNAHIVTGEPAFSFYRTVGPVWVMAGETKTYQVDGPGCGQDGPTQLTFMVDPQNHVQESNEGNNTKTATANFPSYSGSDLIVTKVQFNPAQPRIGDRVLISVEMKNQGTSPAIFCNTATEWMSTGPTIQTGSTTRTLGGGGAAVQPRIVQPGQTFNGGLYVIEPGQLAPGSYPFSVTVDPGNKVHESNEANNTMVGTVTIVP